MTTLWGDILQRFNKTSKQLQSVEFDLGTVVSVYEFLIRYVLDLRSMFDTYEERAVNKSGHKIYRKIRKRKRELTVDEKREGEINFEIRYSLRINTYYAIIDKLHSELERKNLYYDEANKKFNFLFQIIKLPPLEVYKKTQILQNIYKNDFSSSFANECIQFRSYLMSLTENIRPKTIVDIFIRTEKLQ
ncbi:unnamed protein product [Macrosiphum euphorbiae]|uniref:Uncharacterized protein n=1 Tax=Macrosiphum euphorbiae TaxID=13131 RepID=A0AAV0X8A9_9HEMI|nr:unnamed protein product [Macrosiphum euphorbiae]